jgi:lipoate-protein ligase A
LQRWRYIVESALSAAYGLAVDEMLTRSIAEKGSVPILHLYTYRPSVMVGRFQNLEESIRLERCKELGIEYNRRITGGGTVIMGEKQLALGFGIHLSHPKMPRTIRGIFDILGGAILNGLRRLGIEAGFRPKNDIHMNGKKIAGMGASVEEGDVLLFHTSLLVDFDIPLMLEILNLPLEKISDKGISCFGERLTTIQWELGREVEMEEVMEAVLKGFEEAFDVEFERDEFTEWERKKAKELVEEKYSKEDWLFCVKKPSKRMGMAMKKTPGGLLQVYVSLLGQVIESIIITGDFFSSPEVIRRAESALRWTKAERESVERVLREVMVDNAIWGVSVSALAKTIMRAIANCSKERI